MVLAKTLVMGCFFASLALAEETILSTDGNRNKKLFSLFSVVTFPNE